MPFSAPISRRFLPLLLLCAVFFSACAPAPAQTPISPTTPIPATPSPAATAAPPLYSAPPLAQGCELPGSLRDFTVPTHQAAVGELKVRVYFPPCYDAAKSGYPLLVLLHGQTYTQTQWERLGAARAADELILSGQAKPFLILMPYEQHQYRKPNDAAFDLAIIKDLLPWAEESLGACASRACRAVGGISRGASWAVRLGLLYWDEFGALGAHSLPTFDNDVKNLPKWIDSIPRAYLPRVWLDTGTADNDKRYAAQFEQALTSAGVPHVFHLWEGRHNEEYWGAHIQEYITWYAAGWQELP